MEQALAGIKIWDVSSENGGTFAAKILEDLGAEVTRSYCPSQEGSLAGSEQGSCREAAEKCPFPGLQPEEFHTFVRNADVLIEDLGPGIADRHGIGYQRICELNPQIIYISITGYGHRGVMSDYSDSDAIVQALSGMMSITGELNGPLTKIGFRIADVFSGIHAAIAAMAGLIYKKRYQKSLYADIAKLSVMLSAMPDSLSKYLNTGMITRPKGSRHQLVGFFQPTRTKDGAVVIMATQDHQFKALTKILGIEGIENDPRFSSAYLRCRNADALETIIEDRTKNYATDELMERLLQNNVPSGPVQTLEEVLSGAYVREKHLIKEINDESHNCRRTVAFPVEFTYRKASESTVETGRARALYSRTLSGGFFPGNTEKPLSGLRILDMTLFMAGPLGVEILENLGAEIIKIERKNITSDFSRTTEPVFGTTSAYYVALNGGKKDIALDLKNPKHRDLVLRLAERCDVVTENFRPCVTERLGLTYEDVRKVNPSVIYSSVSGFGQKGSFSRRGCVDTVAQAMSGLMRITGREGDGPIRAGSSIADVCASLFEVIGILTALIEHEKTGESIQVDTPMIGSMIYSLSDEVSGILNEGKHISRCGNADPKNPLFRTYPAVNGEIMIDISSDEALRKIFAALNLEEELSESGTAEERSEKSDSIIKVLSERTKQFTARQLRILCRDAGIPAGEVFTQEEILRSGYAEERGLIKFVTDSLEGSFKVIGNPVIYDRFNSVENTFTPQPGEHTSQIFREILGMSDSEIREILD